ncbi:hypothetical protein ThrDRAFT_03927, partial [Frankia casuarinae]
GPFRRLIRTAADRGATTEADGCWLGSVRPRLLVRPSLIAIYGLPT